MIVKFSDEGEFLKECQIARVKGSKGPVRVTRLYSQEGGLPYCHMFVVAAFAHDGELIRMVAYIGQCWVAANKETKDSEARAEQLILHLQESLKNIGMEVRAGLYLEGTDMFATPNR